MGLEQQHEDPERTREIEREKAVDERQAPEDKKETKRIESEKTQDKSGRGPAK